MRLPLLHAPLAALGRQGARAVTAVVFLGVAVPSLGKLLKPFVTEAVFGLLCIAFLRVDLTALKSYARRPTIVLVATLWSSLAVPAVFGVCSHALGFDTRAPDLFQALMLQMIVSPIMAAPAFAALMGLDATLVLITLVAGTVLIPVTVPFFAHLFLHEGIALSPSMLGLKLAAILTGSLVVGIAVRRLVGANAIERHRESIDGINILILFVFVAAIMESVGNKLTARPGLIALLAMLAFAVFFLLLGITTLLFIWAGRERAFALGVATSQRNMGLMLAATGGAVPDLVWLYFALAQFPIYLSPQLLRPLADKLMARTDLPGWSRPQ